MKRLNLILTLVLLCTFSYSQFQFTDDLRGEAAADEFGRSLALSADGNTVVIAAAKNDNLNGFDAGQVTIYSRNGVHWEQVGDQITGRAAQNRCGFYVDMSHDGSRIIFSDHLDDQVADNSGMVRIFEWDGIEWSQLGENFLGNSEGDRLGSSSISGDGNVIAVSAPYSDQFGFSAGETSVFEWIGNEWTQIGATIAGENELDLSGISSDISDDGKTIAIASSGYNQGTLNSGQVRVFQLNGDTWTQKGQHLTGEINERMDKVSLSGDGNRLAISGANKVRIFTFENSNWNEEDVLFTEQFGDNYGVGLSLSQDGETLCIGASLNSGNGDESGSAHIFTRIDNEWRQFGNDINGIDLEDRAGNLSLSADGLTLALGSYLNDDTDKDAGHVRFFNLSDELEPLDCAINDSLSLVKFYNAYDGPNWPHSWDLTTPYSTWYGVLTNDEGCLICLDLDGFVGCSNPIATTGNGLFGDIASLDTIIFPHLQRLKLGRNEIFGELPGFQDYQSLREIDLQVNNISGELAQFVSSKYLVNLNLRGNNISGAMSNFEELPILQSVDLGKNELSGCYSPRVCDYFYFNSLDNGALAWEGNHTNFCNGTPVSGAPCDIIPEFLEFMNEDCICELPVATSQTFKNDFSVFPNPASEYLIVMSEIPTDFYEIYSLSGTKLVSGEIKESLIFLNGLTNGLYVLKIKRTGDYVSQLIHVIK